LAQRNPDRPEYAAPLISALVRSSKWDEALRVVDNFAKSTPKSPLPEFNRGQVYVARGNFALAQASFDKALTLDPKFQPALYFRGSVSAARGDSEAAKKDFESLLAQNPTSMLAYIKLTQIALNGGDEQKAVSLLDQAIKAAPNDPTPRLALANYQLSRGKNKDAQATVNGLLQVSRNNPEGLALQGKLQLLQGDSANAIKTFRAITAANATSPAAYGLLASALYTTKDQTGAEDAARRAIELAPTSSQLRQVLIDIQIGGGKAENALATARAYANTSPGVEADLLLSETLFRLKRADEAQAVLDKSLVSKPDVRVVTRLSQMAMDAGNTKKAVSTLANWVAKNPNDFDTRKAYATTMMSANDLSGARKEYEALLKLHPEDAVVLNNLGWLVQKDDPNRALSLVSLASKIAPRSAEIADTLGWLKYQRQDHQGALPELQRAHDIDANNAPISYHLALALDANGKRAEAKSLLQTTLEKNAKFDGADDARKVLARW
jgi:putative PEP-CTERM system TPR-repeat lipoprotein